MGTGRGGPLLFLPPNAMLPTGTMSGLLAANGTLAVLTLANASGYNQEPETSASHGKEQRRVEIRVLRWEFPGWSKRKA